MNLSESFLEMGKVGLNALISTFSHFLPNGPHDYEESEAKKIFT